MGNAALASVAMCHSVPFVCQLFAVSVGGSGEFALAQAYSADITTVNGYGYPLPDRITEPAKIVLTRKQAYCFCGCTGIAE